MSATLRQLRSRVEDFSDAAQDSGRRAASAAGSYTSDASGRLQELWSEIESLITRRGPEVARQAQGYAHDAGDFASETADQLVVAVRQRPMLAIGIAVAATWIVATLMHAPRRGR